MDRIEKMRLFLRVADFSSFSRAAEDLGLPKATVSTAVQELEATLGTRLFHRTTRKVQLTQDGSVFYQRGKDLLEDVDRVENLFRQGSTKVEGRIRFDLPTKIARDMIVPKIPEFLEMYPGVELEISSTDRKVDLIREGFDCVMRVGTIVDQGLIARRISEMPMINLASPGYLKKYGTPRGIADLQKHYLVHYSHNLGSKPEGFEYHDGKSYVTIPMKGLVTVNNTDNYTAACIAGLGIIQVPSLATLTPIKSKDVTEILPRLTAEAMPVNLVYPHRRHLPTRVQIFMDWLQATFTAGEKQKRKAALL